MNTRRTSRRDAVSGRSSTLAMRLYLAAVLAMIVILHLALLFNVYDLLKASF